MTLQTLYADGSLLEIILMLLLVATMVHAVRLERALGSLRRDRETLQALADGFGDSLQEAERGIERLRKNADGAGRHIARHVDDASGLKSDLEFLIARGQKTADRLEAVVGLSRSADGGGVQPIREWEAPGAPMPGLQSPHVAADPDTMPRSQAERDLLMALRAAR